jgi:hypothetical protein
MKQPETGMHMREGPIDIPLPVYRHVDPDGALRTLAALAPFRAVVVAEVPMTPAQQNRISDWLVAEGCLYAMAWGVAASSWDDAIDWANIAKFSGTAVPESGFVMTTWHDDETLSEVFDYAVRCASHPTEALDELIVVHVAVAADPQRIQAAFRVVCPSDHKEHS